MRPKVLVLENLNASTKVSTNASSYNLGALLLQEQDWKDKEKEKRTPEHKLHVLKDDLAWQGQSDNTIMQNLKK